MSTRSDAAAAFGPSRSRSAGRQTKLAERAARDAETSLALVDTDPAELGVDAVVVGVHCGQPGDTRLVLAAGSEDIDAAFDGRLTDPLALLGATGATGEVTKLATLGTTAAPLVAAVGLGPEPDGPATEPLRRAAGAAVRALAGCRRVALALPLSDADPASLRA